MGWGDLMADDAVILDKVGAVAWARLNRPDRRNALSREMVERLNAVLDAVVHDPDVRVLALTGTGDRAFCAGADLKERAEMSAQEVPVFVDRLRQTMKSIHDLPKVVVACINGAALGGGLEMAAACDLRYGVAGARLGLTETSLGIIPGAGGTQYVPRLIGIPRAKEMILSARPISAAQAHAWGLLNGVWPEAEFLERVSEVLAVVAANAPIALAQAKSAIDRGIEVPLTQGLEIERACYTTIVPTQDRLEGLRAFKEKRTPRFLGR